MTVSIVVSVSSWFKVSLTKQCVHCKEEKPLSEFSWNNRLRGIRQKHCKKCMSYFSKQHYQKHKDKVRARNKKRTDKMREQARKYVWNYLIKHPCEVCGERDPRVLEFDHLDPSSKTASISRMVSDGYSLDTIKAEIAGCRVVCANCHRKKNYRDGGWWTG